jgi:hypothetical protein
VIGVSISNSTRNAVKKEFNAFSVKMFINNIHLNPLKPVLNFQLNAASI